MTTLANMLPNGDKVRIFGRAVNLQANLKSTVRGAGLFSVSNELNERAAGAGNLAEIRHFNPLTGESVPGSDNIGQKIVPDALSGGSLTVARQFRNKAWEAAALTSTVFGEDVPGHAAAMLGAWQARDEQACTMALLAAVYADAKQNNDKNMYWGDGSDYLSGATLARAAQTKGEWKSELKVLVVHSEVHTKLLIDNQITVIPASDQRGEIEIYQGKRLVVSDAMPVVDAEDGIYTSILCAPGIIAYGEAAPRFAPFEVAYDPAAGNGSGGETLYTRRQFIIGVNGYSLTAANVNNATLSAHTSVARVYEQKQIPLTFITTKVHEPA